MRRVTTIAALFVLTLAACSGSDSSDGGSNEPSATYHGGSCTYDGPLEFDVNSTATFVVVNESDTTDVGFAVWKFPEGATSEEVLEKGILSSQPQGTQFQDEPWLEIVPFPTSIGTAFELPVTFEEEGQHGIVCFDVSTDAVSGVDHVTMFTITS
jgi:hypothetical protein